MDKRSLKIVMIGLILLVSVSLISGQAKAELSGMTYDVSPPDVTNDSAELNVFNLNLKNDTEPDWNTELTYVNITVSNATTGSTVEFDAPTDIGNIYIYNDSNNNGGWDLSDDITNGTPAWNQLTSQTWSCNLTINQDHSLPRSDPDNNTFITFTTTENINDGAVFNFSIRAGNIQAQNKTSLDTDTLPDSSHYSKNITADTESPTSSCNVVGDYYWNTTGKIDVEWSASDNLNLSSVELYYRYSSDNSSWYSWNFTGNSTVADGTAASGDWEVDLNDLDGEGHYRFATSAIDDANNSESLPSSQDDKVAFDVTDATGEVNIDGYWKSNTSVTLSWTATDNVNLSEVELFYSYSPDNDTSFGAWTTYGTQMAKGQSDSGTWDVDLINNEGLYRFRLDARDEAGTPASESTTWEDHLGYDVTDANGSASITGYWQSEEFDIDWTASDNICLHKVELYYRYKPDNDSASSFGSWNLLQSQQAGITGTSASNTFTINATSDLDGDGLYQFYMIARDENGTAENESTTMEDHCGFDNTDASGTASVNGYWQSGAFDVNWSATDNVNLTPVELYYRYSPDNTTSFGGWSYYDSSSANGTSASGTFLFGCPDGEGRYEFYLNATDDSGISQSESASPEDHAGYDTVNATGTASVSGYWQSGAFDVNWLATDNVNLSVVELYYRYSPDNTTSFGGWSYYDSSSANGTSDSS
ncbi:MAG: hypothetical protein KGY76_08955, partial [Candidatus Thermoplasmatota archaeon]|nr:hypothetical protein [Candidatus Thermoplasmatota archaeon]